MGLSSCTGRTEGTLTTIYACNCTVTAIARSDSFEIATVLGFSPVDSGFTKVVRVAAFGCNMVAQCKERAAVGSLPKEYETVQCWMFNSTLRATNCLRIAEHSYIANITNVTLCSTTLNCAQVGWEDDSLHVTGTATDLVLDGSPMTAATLGTHFPNLLAADKCPLDAVKCPSIDVQPPTVRIPVGTSGDPPPSVPPKRASLTLGEATDSASLIFTQSSNFATPSSALRRTATLLLTRSETLVVQGASRTVTQRIQRPLVQDPPYSAALSEIMSQSAARATVATATASTAVGGLLGVPGAAVTATRIGLVLSSLDCQYAEADDDPPAPLQYPISSGSGLVAHAVGSLFACALIYLMVIIAVFVHGKNGSKAMLNLVRNLEAMFHQYYGPWIASGSVLVLRHSSDPFSIVCALVSALCESAGADSSVLQSLCGLYLERHAATGNPKAAVGLSSRCGWVSRWSSTGPFLI